MDKPLQILCANIEKIITQLKPQINPVSFVLLTGLGKQGKTALLKQSTLQHAPIAEDLHGVNLFYNDQAIILELGENWLNHSDILLHTTLKQVNRCHRHLKINSLILCVSSADLLQTEPLHLLEQCKMHAQLLEKFIQALGYKPDISLIFSKLDSLAGFCEFFQTDHISELNKPLGFSLDFSRQKWLESYRTQFDRMIDLLGQQIINKMHPARSTVKRTLIREFPLQLASLRIPIQTLIQQIVSRLSINAVYFTSAEQGGISVDRLNQKIQHEYALTVPDKFPQSNNYRAYFIEGALQSILAQTRPGKRRFEFQHKLFAGSATGALLVILAGLGYQHWQTTTLLDEASKELLAYEALSNQNNDQTSALYHLSQAELKLSLIPSFLIPHPIINELRLQIHNNTLSKLHDNFLPDLLNTLEETIANPRENALARYQALKVYLMLGEPEHFSEDAIVAWFNTHWQNKQAAFYNDKQLLLLKNALRQPFQPLTIDQQLVSDARNYLNALPATYFYYSLAKDQFPKETIAIQADGFELASRTLPVYFSKAGFFAVMQKIPEITAVLQQENWVLARQDLDNLQTQLEQAYCFDYCSWWNNFIRRTQPLHYQTYQQARQLTASLYQSGSFAGLVQLLQQNTGPEISDANNLFNQKIANQFTSLNLMTSSATQDLAINLNELQKFLTTLSMINDKGQTVFNLTKARFQGENSSDPLSSLYSRVRQLPEPIAGWTKQLADDTWFIFINESRDYLNQEWQKQVYNHYRASIAHRYPLDPSQTEEIGLSEFDRFFAPNGTLNSFVNQYLKPFIDISHAEWQPKEVNGYILPMSNELMNELIRANVISNMFFPDGAATSRIEFSLQKISLDPVVSSLQLTLGETSLRDDQNSESDTQFIWPERGAKLSLNSIEGNHFELEENGNWAFFKMLQKVNVLVDNNDSSSLQILFELNGNSGRYLLKTRNQINPFSPGILTGFNLKKEIA